MNTNRLYEILNETTFSTRKGNVVEDRSTKNIPVTEIYLMPHESEINPKMEKVDVELLTIAVDTEKALEHKKELISILNDYPNPDRLAGGPSYIEVGGEIGSQEGAFQLFALGKVLKLWDIITPSKMGIHGEEAEELARNGFVMITGYKNDEVRIQK